MPDDNVLKDQPGGRANVIVVLPNIGDIIAYGHGLPFCCQEVYPNRNQKKV